VARACLGEEQLQELALEPAEARSAGARAHVEECPACRSRLAAVRRDSALFEELRGVVGSSGGPPTVPGYRIEGELRRGGQAVVYRAVQEATQRVVALKVLAGRSTPSLRERRRFEREVELGSRLAHPGIVTVFDSDVSAGTPWYAMELVAGETLDAFVARTAPDLARRLRLFLELCAAVAHAHRSGVIHRDLKPDNVLLDAEGRVRVLDFGTALPLDARRLTAPGEFLGTLAYAAPEQVSGGEEDCDTRTDVHALGVVLHELVTGTLPLDADGALAEVVERIRRAPPRIPAGLDRDLALILATALEKERARRYPSVEALARDVEHHLAHDPIEARPRRAGYVLAKALRRHRRAALLGGVAALLALVLAGTVARERLLARRASEHAALVRAMFQDVLGAAAPQRMGGDAPLREVLALAARGIETALVGAPDVQAAVQLTIGDTYRRLLMFPEAEGHLRRALARYREVAGDGADTAHCLELLGAALAAQASPEAIPIQEEALAIRRRLHDAGDAREGAARIAASERALAGAILAQVRDADVARARALLGSALARFRALHGDDHVEVAETRLALARLASWESGAEAEAELAAALATFERHAREDPRDPRRIDCLVEYSAFLQVRRRYDEAEGLLARAQELARELYGDELASKLLRRQAGLAQARGEHARSVDSRAARWPSSCAAGRPAGPPGAESSSAARSSRSPRLSRPAASRRSWPRSGACGASAATAPSSSRPG
jgi:tetratricopeptide (TPR) repeat protein